MKNYFNKLFINKSSDFFCELEKKLTNNEKTFIITANPETFIMGESDKEFNDIILDKKTILVPDGIGIVKAARILKYPIQERIPGIDIATKLLEYCNKYKKSIYLYGSKQEVIDKMIEKIKTKYPNSILLGAKNGYNKDKDYDFIEISKLKPDVVLVALGMKTQEMLIYKHLKKFDKGIFVGVGGSFDVLSGIKKRAPKIFQKLNLEWFYRIICEPSRIKRFYNNNIKFMIKIMKNK